MTNRKRIRTRTGQGMNHPAIRQRTISLKYKHINSPWPRGKSVEGALVEGGGNQTTGKLRCESINTQVRSYKMPAFGGVCYVLSACQWGVCVMQHQLIAAAGPPNSPHPLSQCELWPLWRWQCTEIIN